MALITEAPLSVDALLREAHDPAAGGIVIFCGEIRGTHFSKKVDYLLYESFVPMAAQMLNTILEEAKVKWNLHYAGAMHRIGRLEISDCAVIVVTAHAHRGEAYEANQYIIDRIKNEVPIWKCEYFTDGTHEWGGTCHCAK
jgi:molybdopterin synthase catalytic subunit